MGHAGIEPSGLADPATLIRRLHLVLAGLPPSREQVEQFEAESLKRPEDAWSRAVDRLLASPAYAERFARHWLDVVRFTETHGNEWNYDAAYAWRYRDYVVRAFANDLPFDRMVREHVAGDLLASPRRDLLGTRDESSVATAFFRFGEVNHDSCVQFGIIGYDILDNELDTLTKAFQATTVACARCHDHKMDPVSTRDYHALLGVLRSSRPVMRTLDAPDRDQSTLAQLQDLKASLRPELAALWRRNLDSLEAATLDQLARADTNAASDPTHPLYPWTQARAGSAESIRTRWTTATAAFQREREQREEFNRTHFTSLADFRQGIPEGWYSDGAGMRQPPVAGGGFTVSGESNRVVGQLLGSGLTTFELSARLNGALRSPTLKRTASKMSFEVTGGRFSLARLVFNSCQLNYNHQHSIHHDNWSWITIDFPENTDALFPYAELLTFWDNPKFPDPLGTLGKDTENQRGPFEEHARDPRSWWGIRRIVVHNDASVPKPETDHLLPLHAEPIPDSLEAAVARYVSISREAVDAFALRQATDAEVRWLEWLLKTGVLRNSTKDSPALARLVDQYRRVESRILPPTTMPTLADEGSPVSQPVLLRGQPTRPGDAVPRGFIQALTPAGFEFGPGGSGRRELAELMASDSNPLTARVMVNRVWQWVFGRGLVATPDDFGHLGDLPSHPELLDHLASEFMADGWSVKHLVRRLVLTRAFRSAAAPTESARERDPANRLLSHWTARRAEAEVIRDSLLAVSGRLDSRQYGPSVHPFREKADPEKRLFTGPLDGDGRRSLYIKFQLMEAPHFLSAFNLPGGKVTQGRRDSSNVPAQSLAMLNDPLVLSLAGTWAQRVIHDGPRQSGPRMEAMFREAIGRPPTAAEVERLDALVARLCQLHDVRADAAPDCLPVWQDAAHALFNLKEFIFIP